MNCERIQPELVDYHFGVIEDGTRHEIEGHLMCCSDCLCRFLSLKRDIELAESGPCPSPALLDRLRVSAARELDLPEPRSWSWWERPFSFAFAGVVVLIAMVAVSALAREPGSAPHGLATSSTAAR